MMATPRRAAMHSRRTAACMSSPSLGKYHGRSHWPDELELGPARDVRGVHGGRAARLERVAFMRARERAERDRRIGRAVGRRADLGDGNAKRVGGDGEAVDVRELALIRAEAERSVALDVLDRAIVLAHGEMDVGSRDVVLEIDEGLLAVPLGLSVGNTEDAPGSESSRARRCGCRSPPRCPSYRMWRAARRSSGASQPAPARGGTRRSRRRRSRYRPWPVRSRARRTQGGRRPTAGARRRDNRDGPSATGHRSWPPHRTRLWGPIPRPRSSRRRDAPSGRRRPRAAHEPRLCRSRSSRRRPRRALAFPTPG